MGRNGDHRTAFSLHRVRAARVRTVLAGAVIAAAVISCAPRTADHVATNASIDRRLRALAEARPDSIVGVLIRTAAPPDSAWQASMAEAGLAIGTIAGDVVTGRIRARSALDVARLPFVVHIELAREIPILQHPS